MKIAILFDSRDFIGGGRTHVENICKNLLKDYGCEIDIYTRNLKIENENFEKIQHLYRHKIKVFRCGRKTNFFNIYGRLNSLIAIIFLFFKNCKKNKYDIIHAHSPLLFPIGKMLSIIKGIPIIITNHGANILDKGEKNLLYYFENWILTKIKYDCEITVGSSFLKYKNVNKPVVIGNGVNLEDFTINKNVLKNKIKKLLFVGRLERTKGVDILIKAIDILVNEKQLENFELNIVGYGYDEQKYKQEIKNLGLENYIHFRGKIVGKELAKIYSESDIMLVSSRTEGFGIMVLEAMASGIPIISTKCGGPEDIIVDGKNGFLVENENPEAFAQKIEDILSNNTKNIQKIVDNALKLTKEQYSWDTITAEIVNVYKKITKIKSDLQ